MACRGKTDGDAEGESRTSEGGEGKEGGPRGKMAGDSEGKGGRNERWKGGVTLEEEKEKGRRGRKPGKRGMGRGKRSHRDCREKEAVEKK